MRDFLVTFIKLVIFAVLPTLILVLLAAYIIETYVTIEILQIALSFISAIILTPIMALWVAWLDKHNKL